MSKPRAKAGIMDTPLYVGGRAKIEGVAKSFKLSSNENALGASRQVLRAIKKMDKVAIYPNSDHAELRGAIAALHDLHPDRIICGAGSDEIFHLLAQAYIGEGDEIIHTEHGFLIYAIVARAAGGTPISVAEKDLTANVDAVLEAVTPATKIVFLANPNNPTGTMLPQAELMRLHDNLRDDILLVLDCAYAEFIAPENYPHGFDLVARADNVVVTRTFSKAYGLAALRLGWAYCPVAVCDALNHLRGPFNVNQIALDAGLVALADQDHIKASRAHNTQWRDWLVQQLNGLGFTIRPSQANFILLEFASADEAQKADKFMCQCGVIARQLAAYGLPHALRLSIGTQTANRAVLDVLANFMKETRS